LIIALVVSLSSTLPAETTLLDLQEKESIARRVIMIHLFQL